MVRLRRGADPLEEEEFRTELARRLSARRARWLFICVTVVLLAVVILSLVYAFNPWKYGPRVRGACCDAFLDSQLNCTGFRTRTNEDNDDKVDCVVDWNSDTAYTDPAVVRCHDRQTNRRSCS